ncbi:MAG: DUF1707 domain-containing protein [Spirochaetales bacterium]|nr:DUF1707 domain-containing protein [Spirochaetales bacterium]
MGIISDFQRITIAELRKETIELLQKAYADGRIGVDTLERRLEEATKAQEKDSLVTLVADIPTDEDDTYRSEPKEESPWLTNPGRPENRSVYFAMLGGTDIKGAWKPAHEIQCYSILGGIDLDFRDALFPKNGDITVKFGCLMGGVDIVVPPGVNVHVQGFPLLGGIDDKAGAGEEGAPTIHLKGMVVLGGLDVKRRDPKRLKNGETWTERLSKRARKKQRRNERRGR